MGLEAFSYVTSLNASNPIHATDPVSQGDDHVRGLKTTLLNTFANLDAAVTFTPTEANRLTGLTGLTGTGNLVASISPTFTGTIIAAACDFSGAVTALTYDGVAAADLVDKGATEAITGEWTFSDLIGGVMVATSYDGIAAADLLDKGATEVITGAWDFTTGPEVADLELGHASDTTLTRAGAGLLEVEGAPVITHDDAALGSGKVFFSESDPSGGANGDIWYKHEA